MIISCYGYFALWFRTQTFTESKTYFNYSSLIFQFYWSEERKNVLPEAWTYRSYPFDCYLKNCMSGMTKTTSNVSSFKICTVNAVCRKRIEISYMRCFSVGNSLGSRAWIQGKSNIKVQNRFYHLTIQKSVFTFSANSGEMYEN